MSLKYEACAALAAVLDDISGLAGKVHAGSGEPDHRATFPCVTLTPRNFSFEPWQENEVAVDTTVAGNDQLMEVGNLIGKVEVSISTRAPAERETYEDMVLNAFMQRVGAPGTLVVTCSNVTVAGVATGYDAPITFCLDSADWQDEMVFDKKRGSFMDLEVVIPVLVLRTAVYDIDTLTIALTHDLTSDDPVVVGEIAVDEDGITSIYEETP
jgi:hypothetical protein